MVRLKNRYLLVNILYPELEKRQGKTSVPDIVTFNQPTTDALDARSLLKGLRAEVQDIFGDYGSGAISDSLSVKYLSPATSTFILRVSRDHYRIAWAALSLMTSVPVKDGKNCVFRVVRVSGTIKKAEEEAIRRAREMILKATREAGDRGDSTLDDMFGNHKGKATPETTKDNDISMVDRSDSEDEEEVSDGDG